MAMSEDREVLLGGSALYDEEFRARQRILRERSEEAARAADAVASRRNEVSVLVVDDQELVRSGFRLVLSSYDHIHVVGEAADGREAVDKAKALRPDVVLMDIRMPVENGIEATGRITSDPELSEVRVLILTTFDLDEYVYDALAAGASGFMLKDAEPDDIVDAIDAVAAGDALIQPSITRRLIEAFVGARANKGSSTGRLSALTEREREILSKVAGGLTNDEIAEELVISPATVKTHVARIMSKTEAHDRAQLVVLAYEEGLVTPGSKRP